MVGKIVRGFQVVESAHRAHPELNIVLPKRGSKHSAGYDFYTPIAFTLCPGQYQTISTDIKAYMQPDEVLLIYPRSSVGLRGLVLVNTVGVIDADYYSNSKNDGNIRVVLQNIGHQPFEAAVGDRVVQGVFSKYLLTDQDSLENGHERKGGHGHTGD